MKLELKSIQHSPANSEETACFAAFLWMDGVKSIEVRNSGRGGCNDYHDFVSGATAKFEAFCKTQPPIPNPYGDKKPFDADADLIIGELFDAWILGKEKAKFKKQLAKKIMYTRKDKPGIWSVKVEIGSERGKLFLQKNRDAIDVVLNHMGIDDAFKLVTGTSGDVRL